MSLLRSPAVSLLCLIALVQPPATAAPSGTQNDAGDQGWFAWNPPADDFKSDAFNLRSLNEKFAGELGRIQAEGDHFVHSSNGQAVRFWAVNGTGDDDAMGARVLAKYGVNLVRLHGSLFDKKTGALQLDAVAKRAQTIKTLKGEGIYSLLSIYFPLWMDPSNGPGWHEGYNGKQHPFALLFFEPEFQELYRGWWKIILTTRTPDGTLLLDDPALMGLELLNEDSFFFWSFNYQNIPDPQMRKLEKLFGDWAAKKYGNLRNALSAWKNLSHARDDLDAGRLGFRGLHEMVTQKTPRDQDTATFLFELQRNFYADTVRYIRGLGYKGMITASNWTTANNDILGPLEKLSYMPGDFIDHHGYFGTNHQGPNSSWSLRAGHTYSAVSALRFEAEKPGAPVSFANPVIDPMYNSRPSMISEIAWNRPNPHRSEAPIFLATYASLQDTDAVVHFAFDSARWAVKPGFFMQPWTLMSPSQMGQFPAAAFIYRQGLLKPGDLMIDIALKTSEAQALKGVPLSQKANLDALRKDDVAGETAGRTDALDPLIYFVGRTNVRIDERGGKSEIKDATSFIDRRARTVLSSTREIKLDYGRGVLALNAPSAQGLSGDLKQAGTISLKDIEIASPLEIGHIIAVALDGKPLASSSRILVQAMSEEKPSGWATAPAGEGVLRVTNLGQDPWLVRALVGKIRFKRADATRLKVTTLDLNGHPLRSIGHADGFDLLSDCPYYLITP